MIVKPSTKAQELAELDTFIGRSAFEGLPERIRKEALNRKRGLSGERYAAHILDREFHDNSAHALLHDLRLPDGIGGFAQFDHVLLSRLSRTASIFEVKNFSGRLSRNQHNEWHLWYDGRRRPKSIPNPIEQARRQREVLRAWMKQNRHDRAFEKIYIFVIMPPGCDIDRSKVTSDDPVYKADNVMAHWLEVGGTSPFGRLLSSGVSSETLQRIAVQLASCHQPEPIGLVERLSVGTTACDPPPAQSHLPAQPGPTVSAGTTNVPEPAFSDVLPTERAFVVESLISNHPLAGCEAASTVSEVAPGAALSPTEPSPDVVGVAKSSKRAAPLVAIARGISSRVLPDGRVAFVASKDDPDAIERLRLACKGRGQWKPLFGNWLCDAASAAHVRDALQLGPSTSQQSTQLSTRS